MPKRKKKASDMTDAELEKRVFPKKVLEELMQVAHEGEETDGETPEDSSSQQKSNT